MGVFLIFCGHLLAGPGCFIHNFGYRYARKPFKGSKNADFGLVSEKNLGQKNGSMGWGPGPGKVAKKMQKHPHS